MLTPFCSQQPAWSVLSCFQPLLQIAPRACRLCLSWAALRAAELQWDSAWVMPCVTSVRFLGRRRQRLEVLGIYYPFFYVCFLLRFMLPSNTVTRPKQSSKNLERYQHSGESSVCCKLHFIKGVSCQDPQTLCGSQQFLRFCRTGIMNRQLQSPGLSTQLGFELNCSLQGPWVSCFYFYFFPPS